MFGSKKNNTLDTRNRTTAKRDFSTFNGAVGHNRIGEGTLIEGEITCEGDIRMDGELNGSLNCKAKLAVGATGVIIGDIICQNADVSGRIEGTLRVKDVLHLKSTANVKGDIVTKKLVVDPEAVFNGKCTMPIDGKFKLNDLPNPIPNLANSSNESEKEPAQKA